MKTHVICFMILWGTTTLAARSQDSCQLALVKATEAYDQGMYGQVINLLEKRVKQCDYSKEAQIQAMKILAASYTELDDIENAETTTREFIKKNPVYKLQGIDPPAFATSFNKYSITPRFSVNFDIGIGAPIVQIIREFRVWDAPNYKSTYEAKTYFTADVGLQWHISNRWSSGIEWSFTNLGFNRKITYGDLYSLDFSETVIEFKTPMYIGLNVFNNKGISVSVMSGAYLYVYGFINRAYSFSFGQQTGNDSDNDSTGRNITGAGLMEGLKVSYTLDQFQLSLSPRYYHNINMYDRPSQRYKNPSLSSNQLYVDDDLKIHRTELLLGISYVFSYKIKHKYR